MRVFLYSLDDIFLVFPCYYSSDIMSIFHIIISPQQLVSVKCSWYSTTRVTLCMNRTTATSSTRCPRRSLTLSSCQSTGTLWGHCVRMRDVPGARPSTWRTSTSISPSRHYTGWSSSNSPGTTQLRYDSLVLEISKKNYFTVVLY